MINNRRYSRTPLNHHLDVIDRSSSFAIGVIVDVSKEGVRIASGKRMKRNLILQLELPEISGKKNLHQITFDAKSCWSTKCTDGFFESGFQIYNVSHEAQRLLSSFNFQ